MLTNYIFFFFKFHWSFITVSNGLFRVIFGASKGVSGLIKAIQEVSGESRGGGGFQRNQREIKELLRKFQGFSEIIKGNSRFNLENSWNELALGPSETSLKSSETS